MLKMLLYRGLDESFSLFGGFQLTHFPCLEDSSINLRGNSKLLKAIAVVFLSCKLR